MEEPSDTRGDADAVLDAMDRLRSGLWARDPGVIDVFTDDPDVLLVGSDDGEVARGRDGIGALMLGLFALPVRLWWDWKSRDVGMAGDVAWVFADCDVVIADADGEKRKPYRITGVLQRAADGCWRWRQFHGSQPAG